MDINEIPHSQLNEYARISIAFTVSSILEARLLDKGLGGIQLVEQPVPAYIKDYDMFDSPLSWSHEFDIKNWRFFLAQEGEKIIGGAALVWNTSDVNILDGRDDLSVLWDLRVAPEMRRCGVGKKLFEHAAAWSKSKNCVQMKIETQNINVNACRFYASMGAELGDIRRFAYRHDVLLNYEVQLNWYLSL